MSDQWTMGGLAAQDTYGEPGARITVRPRRFEWPVDPPTEEERRLAEYAAALQPPPKREEPAPIQPSVYDTQQFSLRPPVALPPAAPQRGVAEARSIQPTLRERGAQTMMGESPSTTRARLVRTLMGTTGVGETGLGAVDFVPFLGSALGSQEEAAKGDYQMAAVNAMPGGKPARKATGALKKVVAEALTPSKIPERNVGFAPGSVLDPLTAPIAPRPPAGRSGVDFWREEPAFQAAAPYVNNPQRVLKPGVYKDPREIAREAAANVAPEHPAMKALFGVTRDDLYEIGQRGTRKGNIEPSYSKPEKISGSYVSDALMNPRNAQRQIDALTEAQKYPELIKGMDSWYVMDPAFRRMEQLVGREQAIKDYNRFNTVVPMFSPASPVTWELNRGTAANMMINRGQWDQFVKHGGTAVGSRGKDFPEALRDVIPHPYHSTAQAGPVGRYLESGAVDMSQPKVPLYMQASGVPETGFQTRLPVPDAHWGRSVGVGDVRTNANPGVSLKGPEYHELGPWYRENVARPMGIEAVPAQGRQWGLYAPQTGVDTAIGAPKLELLAQMIWERAAKLGIDPKVLRDAVLRGDAHATWLLGASIPAGMMGGLASQDSYEPRGL